MKTTDWTAIIRSEGDPSVGILPDHIEVVFKGTYEPYGDDERAELRDKLIEMFTDFCDMSVGVQFDDECPDCGRVMNLNGGNDHICPASITSP